MGRGAFEHNYQALDLPALRDPQIDAQPLDIALDWPTPTASITTDLYCAENEGLARWLQAQGMSFRLIYLDPPFASGKTYAARIDGERGGHHVQLALLLRAHLAVRQPDRFAQQPLGGGGIRLVRGGVRQGRLALHGEELRHRAQHEMAGHLAALVASQAIRDREEAQLGVAAVRVFVVRTAANVGGRSAVDS